MKILIFLTFLALSAAKLEDFHKFTAKFFSGVGIIEDVNLINKCITEAEEMAWETIYMNFETTNWDVLEFVVMAVGYHTNGVMLLLTKAYMCALDKVKVKAIIDKIVKLLENEQRLMAKIAGNRGKIADMFKAQLAAKKRGEFAEAGTIAANFVTWFFLND